VQDIEFRIESHDRKSLGQLGFLELLEIVLAQQEAPDLTIYLSIRPQVLGRHKFDKKSSNGPSLVMAARRGSAERNEQSHYLGMIGLPSTALRDGGE
jgi:hypothetical protein